MSTTSAGSAALTRFRLPLGFLPGLPGAMFMRVSYRVRAAARPRHAGIHIRKQNPIDRVTPVSVPRRRIGRAGAARWSLGSGADGFGVSRPRADRG
jgi:hypothetical protein